MIRNKLHFNKSLEAQIMFVTAPKPLGFPALKDGQKCKQKKVYKR